MKPIYLDHSATTLIHPEVLAHYTKTLESTFGNPSSIHFYGREARRQLDEARKKMAYSIQAHPPEIIFTSGGTEADNMAIFGAVAAMRSKGNHIITTNIEHHAVLNPCKQLASEGYDVTYLEADSNGKISKEQVEKELREDTIFVSIMYGNNEVGSIQPIREIGEVLQNHQAVFHTDAVQAYGIVPLNVEELGVDLMSVSAHKLNGPKGIGFLYQRSGFQVDSLLFGGEQERKRRAGTENVPAIAAFAKAVEIACQTMEENKETYKSYKKIFTTIFDQADLTYEVNSKEIEKLPHILNVSFPGTDIESLLVNLDMSGVCVSGGSACTAGSLDPSHVLVAMYGEGAPQLRNSVRFSFGYGLDELQIEQAAKKTAEIVTRLVK